MPIIPAELDWLVISMAAALVAVAAMHFTRHFRRTD